MWLSKWWCLKWKHMVSRDYHHTHIWFSKNTSRIKCSDNNVAFFCYQNLDVSIIFLTLNFSFSQEKQNLFCLQFFSQHAKVLTFFAKIFTALDTCVRMTNTLCNRFVFKFMNNSYENLEYGRADRVLIWFQYISTETSKTHPNNHFFADVQHFVILIL